MKLKKVMSFVIAGVIAASAAMTALAEEGSVSFTPDEVVEWLQEGDEKAEDVNGQILNGVSRLAEMLLIVDVAAGPDEEQMGTVNALLNDVASCEGSEDLDVLQKTGLLAAGTVHALDVLVDAIDEGDQAEDARLTLKDAFTEADAATETAQEQTANALLFAARFASLGAQRAALSEEQAAELAGGLDTLEAEFMEAADVDEETNVAAKWLYKFLGALAKLSHEENVDVINSITEKTEAETAAAEGPKQAAVSWLYGAVNAAGGIIGTMNM